MIHRCDVLARQFGGMVFDLEFSLPGVGYRPGGRAGWAPVPLPAGGPFVSRGGTCWSGWRQGEDAGERAGDVLCPGPGRRDFQVPAALAFDDPPGGMQDLVTQRLWFCFGQVAVEGEEPQPGQQVTGDGGGLAPGGADLVVSRWQMSQPVLFAQRMLSSALAWVLWRASRNWTWPRGVLVAVTW